MKIKLFILIAVLGLIGLNLKSNQMKLFDFFKKSTTKKTEVESEENIKPQFIEEVYIADLALPSGSIIASDPFFTFDARPFNRSVKPGKYPVSVSIYQIEENHYRIGKATLKFSEEEVDKWELAVSNDISKEQIDSLKSDEFFGFPVDAGLGCFVDNESNIEYNRLQDELLAKNSEANYYDDVLATEFKSFTGNHKYSSEYGDWNNHLLNEETGHNVIMFQSGWGDGYYPSYWGLGKDGKPKQLIIDFLIVE